MAIKNSLLKLLSKFWTQYAENRDCAEEDADQINLSLCRTVNIYGPF